MTKPLTLIILLFACRVAYAGNQESLTAELKLVTSPYGSGTLTTYPTYGGNAGATSAKNAILSLSNPYSATSAIDISAFTTTTDPFPTTGESSVQGNLYAVGGYKVTGPSGSLVTEYFPYELQVTANVTASGASRPDGTWSYKVEYGFYTTNPSTPVTFSYTQTGTFATSMTIPPIDLRGSFTTQTAGFGNVAYLNPFARLTVSTSLPPVKAVPEPSALAALGSGFVALLRLRRKA